MYSLAFEQERFKDPFFSQYQQLKDSLDESTLNYFKKWYTLIELESSSTNFLVQTVSERNEKSAYQDEGLKMISVETISSEDVLVTL